MAINFLDYPVLCVDDEAPNLLALQFALENEFTVLTATSGQEALAILAAQDVAVLLADQRMPGMGGAELCAKAKEVRPDTVRIIVTGYADVHAAMDAINKGEVARYIAKPWRDDDLSEILRSAIHVVHMQRSVREMEMRLLQSTAATAAYTIHAEVAHEISNVLHAMKLNTEIAHDHLAAVTRAMEDPQQAMNLASTARQCTGDVLAALGQLEGIVQRLRHGSGSQAKETARCDAAHAVDTTIRILRADVERVARLSLVVEASPMLAIESVALAQVVVNLITNAAQMSPVGKPNDNEIVVRVGVTGERGVITISDTGPGIDASIRDRIFDPGVTTRAGGSGIGLAIVRDLVQRAHGKVSFENLPERGARFTISLPIVAR